MKFLILAVMMFSSVSGFAAQSRLTTECESKILQNFGKIKKLTDQINVSSERARDAHEDDQDQTAYGTYLVAWNNSIFLTMALDELRSGIVAEGDAAPMLAQICELPKLDSKSIFQVLTNSEK